MGGEIIVEPGTFSKLNNHLNNVLFIFRLLEKIYKLDRNNFLRYKWSSLFVNIFFELFNKCSNRGGLNSSCEEGYTGPLCSSCENWYSKTSDKYCLKCADFKILLLKIIGIAASFIIFLGMYAFFFIISEEKLMEESLKGREVDRFTLNHILSVYLKIFLNYLQMISTLSQADMNLPNFLSNFLVFSSFFVDTPTQVMSIDCLFQCLIF